MKSTTEAGQRLIDWSKSDVRPIDEFGWRTVEEAVVAIEIEAKAKVPNWKQTRVTGDAREALAIAVQPGSVVSTSEGAFVFEKAGEWILLPVVLWKRTLERLRLAEARFSGRGDGGPRRVS